MKEMKWMMFAMLLMVAGCKENDNSLAKLRAHEWELKSMMVNDTVVNNPTQLPVIFFSDSSAVYGSAGCNRFFGKYTADDKGKMDVKPGGATMMFCPDMNFEDQYLRLLAEVENFSVNDKELKLQGKAGKLNLVYVPADTAKVLGVANDQHGCNAAAGYTWSAVCGDCVRLFEEGVKFSAAAGQDSTLAAYVVFAADSLKAEVFLPEEKQHPVLDRRTLPGGKGYSWNQEDDDTFTVRQMQGLWVIEQRGKVLYSQAN